MRARHMWGACVELSQSLKVLRPTRRTVPSPELRITSPTFNAPLNIPAPSIPFPSSPRLTERDDVGCQYAVPLHHQWPPHGPGPGVKGQSGGRGAEGASEPGPEPRQRHPGALRRGDDQDPAEEQLKQELQSQMGPYTEELKQRVDQRLQEFQDTVVPMADQVQVEMAQRALMVRQAVAPYAEDLKGKLDPYAQDLQAQLTSLYQSFVNVNNSFISRHWECITNIFGYKLYFKVFGQ
uniref:Apolipoprotein A-IV n=1 Tax=Gadus morhua TaxID=8049 RepID=A0A8C5C9W1_GADMO